ncbi:MAG: hypothetical protein FWG31_04185 [Oscillospiraceae bacterium]|nr:hypothetical protein [Oscillospiraceae bacterium]
MRNLKRTASLLIALVMVSAFFVAPAAAADPILSDDLPPLKVTVDGEKTKFADETVATANGQEAPLTTALPIFDIANEKIDANGFTIAGWYDGKKWQAGAPSTEDIAKWLKKGGVMQLTSALSADKKPVPLKGSVEVTETGKEAAAVNSAYTVSYKSVAKKEKAPKLTVNYALFGNNQAASESSIVAALGDTVITGAPIRNDIVGTDTSIGVPFSANGHWTVAEKGKSDVYAEYANLEYSISEDKKNPKDAWAAFPATGVAVRDLPESGKAEKDVYVYRVKAYEKADGTFVPGTSAGKLSVTTLQKAPKGKPNYKLNNLKGKLGWAVATDSSFTVFADKEAAKKGVSIADAISDSEFASVKVFQTATAKKAASAIQTFTLAKQGVISSIALDVSNGKVTDAGKLYEFLDKATEPADTDKWTKFPKLTGAKDTEKVIYIRIKNTAKHDGKNNKAVDDTFAASEPRQVTVKFGVLNPDADAGKQKVGIVSVTLVPLAP